MYVPQSMLRWNGGKVAASLSSAPTAFTPLPHADPTEDGSGAALAKASIAVRMCFSNVTEALQNHARRTAKAATAPPAPVSVWST